MDARLMYLLGFLDQRVDTLNRELQGWPDEVTEARLGEALLVRGYLLKLMRGEHGKDSSGTS